MSNFQLSAVLQANIADFTAKMDQAIGKFKEVAKQPEQLGSKFKSVGGDMTAWGAKATLATAPVAAAMGAAIKSSIDYESAFAGVRKTIDGSEADFAKLDTGIRNMSKRLPASAVDIAGVAEAAGQLGIKKENILGFSETMINLGEATNLTADEAATSFAQFANVVQMPQSKFENLGSSVVALGNNLATTEQDIVNMAMRLAGVGSQVGLTEAEIMAMSGAMSSVGINAEAGGSAMSTVMKKMQNAVSAGGKDLKGFAQAAGMSSTEFANAFKNDPMSAIDAFVQGLGKSGEEGKNLNGILGELGISGINETDTLLRLAGAGDLLSDAVKISSDAWKENSALSDEAAQRYETTAAKLAMFKNKVTDLGITLGDVMVPIMMKVVDFASKWVEKFNGASETTQKIVLAVGAFAVAIGPVVTVLGVFLSSIGTIITAGAQLFGILSKLAPIFNVVRTAMMVLTGPIGIISAIVIALGIVIYKNWDSIKAKTLEVFGKLKTWLSSTWESIRSKTVEVVSSLAKSAVTKFNELKDKVSNAIKVAKSILDNIWNSIKSYTINTVTGLVSGAVSKFNSFKSTISNIFSAIKSFFTNTWNAIKSTVVNLISGFVSSGVSKFNSFRTSVSNVFNNVKSAIQTAIQNARTIAINTIENLRSGAISKFNSLKSSVSTIFTNLKSAITKPIETAKSTLLGIIDKIKGAFSKMKITIPKPKLPKISVSMGTKNFMGADIKVPKFSIDWFAKGGIMTKPTAFGRNGNSVMMGGEAGKEAILPLNKRNLGYIANQMDRYRDNPQKTQQQQPIVLNFNIENMNAKDRKEAENYADAVAGQLLKNLSKRGMR